MIKLRIGHLNLNATSHEHFSPGQELRVRVAQTAGQLTLLIQNNADRAAMLTQALRLALPVQKPLGDLFNALTAFMSNSTQDLPDDNIIGLIRSIMDRVSTSQQISTPAGLKRGIGNSGLFLEQKLLSAPASDDTFNGDLKADLLRLLQLLQNTKMAASSPGSSASPVPLSMNTLEESFTRRLTLLIAQLRAAGEKAIQLQPMLAKLRGLPQQLAELPTLETLRGLEVIMRQAEGALARIQSHQLGSLLSQQGDIPHWQIDVPVKLNNQFSVVHLRIHKDGGSATDPQDSTWAVTVSLQLEQLGEIEAHLKLRNQRLSIAFWAERDVTAILFKQHSEILRRNLADNGLDVNWVKFSHQKSLPTFFRLAMPGLMDIST
ncbi:MAG: hypothetical protein A2V90_07845 [Gammaproteobacteria bacterium RBG_16_57_12]|nr:MAG: hypothetical protein A2V90_07845 [Gammaproteobacteria bacterium RBG_16_57_12]